MNLVDKVKKAGIVLATATGITLGLGATAALADCSAIVSAGAGKTLDGKNQALRAVLHIKAGLRYQDAAGNTKTVIGPPTAWEACSAFADRVFSLAKPFGAVGYRTKMECSGSWVGKYCRDVIKGSTAGVDFDRYRTFNSVGGLQGALRADHRAAVDVEAVTPRRGSAATASFGSVATVERRRETATEERPARRTQVGTLPGGYKVFKCEC